MARFFRGIASEWPSALALRRAWPNPSLNRTRYGRPPGRRSRQCLSSPAPARRPASARRLARTLGSVMRSVVLSILICATVSACANNGPPSPTVASCPYSRDVFLNPPQKPGTRAITFGDTWGYVSDGNVAVYRTTLSESVESGLLSQIPSFQRLTTHCWYRSDRHNRLVLDQVLIHRFPVHAFAHHFSRQGGKWKYVRTDSEFIGTALSDAT